MRSTLCCSPAGATAERWAALAPGADVHAVVPTRRPWRLAWEQTAAPRFAARLGVDLWHGPHYTMPLRLGMPAVVTVHDLTFFDHPEWHERSKVTFFRRMIKASARRGDVHLREPPHRAALACAVARRRVTTVIHHGVDHERFRPDADVDRDRAVLQGHGIAGPYVAFTGTIEPRKDLPTLVAAFARVSDGRPDLRLVLAGGDGWGVEPPPSRDRRERCRDSCAAHGVRARRCARAAAAASRCGCISVARRGFRAACAGSTRVWRAAGHDERIGDGRAGGRCGLC